MRVLWISDNPWNATGFGKVSHYITHHLKEHGLDIVMAGFSSTAIINWDGINVYPYANPLSEFIKFIEKREGEIDVVVFHGSPWIYPFNKILPQIPHYVKTHPEKRFIGYFVHEALEVPDQTIWFFKLCHLLVTPTHYTAKVLNIDRYHVVPHGVNPEIWKPIEEDQEPQIGATISMIAKNHLRKRWDLYFEVIARLLKDGYIVTALPWVVDKGYWNIDLIVNTIEKQHKVKIPIIKPTNYEVFWGIPEPEQPFWYRNITINTTITMGEAWALPITETLAMGIPNIAIDYGAIKEWAGDMIEYIEPAKDAWYYSIDGMKHPIPSVDDAVRKIKDMLDRWEKTAQKAMKASRYVRKHLTWENAAKEMVKAIEKAHEYDTLIVNEEEKLHPPLKPKVIE